jgi:hypothetical protein
MSVNQVGQLSIGGVVPIAIAAQATADASLGLVIPQITAQIAGLIALITQLGISPPSIEGSIALLTQAIGSLQAAVTLPGASANITAIAAALAQLEATLLSLNAQVTASAALAVTLGTPGVWVYSYDGTPRAFGPNFSGAIGGGLPDSLDPDLPINGLVLLTSDGGTWQAMKTCFRTE